MRNLQEPAFRSLDALVQFLVRHDLDVPANQLACQADVLPATADGQRQLVFLDKNDGTAEPRVEKHFLDSCGLQSVRNEHLQRIIPAHNVYALAAQFIDDILDTAAANADASANAIDFHVDARYGHLCAIPCFPRDGFDLDGTVGYFRDFVLKQPANEIGMRPRQDNLYSMAYL